MSIDGSSPTPSPVGSQGAGLRTYTLTGRRGLRVSPLSLGAGTFGERWDKAWQSAPEQVDRIIGAYLDAGGNVIDTADRYQEGQSEERVGDYLRRSGRRDQVVLATKFGQNGGPGDVHQGGNARLTIQRSVEASLRRLGTDVIDLYQLHVWDTFTPVEEVMSTLDALVRAGKIRYIGLSNVPAWYLGRAQTLAEWRGWEPVATLQVNYSLLARTVEYEFVDAAQALGIGLTAWSPLANGLLSGRYRVNEEGELEGDGRVTRTWITDTTVGLTSERTRRMLETLAAVAREVGRTPAQVALSWVTGRPGVVSTVIGPRTEEHLLDSLPALDFELPPELAARLEEAGRPPAQYPYSFFGEDFQGGTVRGGFTIQGEPRGYRGRGWR